MLTAFTLIFMIVVVPLWPMASNAEQYMTSYVGLSDPLRSLGTDVPTLVALIVCLIPTTIGALLAAIGIAGMDRALRANIIAKSGKAVEVAGDIGTVLLDKTGTITVASGDLILCGTDRPCGRSSTSCVASGERSEAPLRASQRGQGRLPARRRAGRSDKSRGCERPRIWRPFAPTFARRDELITTIVETTTYLCHVYTRGQGSEWTYYAVVAQCPKDGEKVSPCCEW